MFDHQAFIQGWIEKKRLGGVVGIIAVIVADPEEIEHTTGRRGLLQGR